ncbi:DUF742 domain-containing protein [Streptomyces sp. NPDC002790]|uniref:DUF742 domain-containing protein n=1 Tax=Streptomyces sp. NPDC002790 TaxID=3154431 RepID=UPI00332B9799
MSGHERADEDATFVRTYTLTRGRTRPRHLLSLDTVLSAGAGRPGPRQAEECEQILSLCKEHQRSVTELAGQLARPVTAVKVLVSDLLDAEALVISVTSAYGSGDTDADERPTTDLLTALAVGLKRKFPDAIPYRQAG